MEYVFVLGSWFRTPSAGPLDLTLGRHTSLPVLGVCAHPIRTVVANNKSKHLSPLLGNFPGTRSTLTAKTGPCMHLVSVR